MLSFWKIVPKGSMTKENKRGPRTEPCGTPHEISAEGEVNDPILTGKPKRWTTVMPGSEPQLHTQVVSEEYHDQ